MREPERARRFELLVRQAAAEGLITPAAEAELLGQSLTPSRRGVADDELRAIAEAAKDQSAPTPEDQAWLDLPGDDLEDE